MRRSRSNLAQIYAYNLCVTKYAYSRPALDAVKYRLAAIEDQKQWWPNVDSGWNRVHLHLLVLDTDAAQLIRADADKIDIDPLVQKAVP